MKTCPFENQLASLAAGEIQGRRKKALLKHIASCDVCMASAHKLDRLQAVLLLSKRDEEGRLTIQPPYLTGQEIAKISQGAFRELRKAKKTREVVDACVDKLVDLLWPEEPVRDVPVVGYCAARPGSRVMKQRAKDKIVRSILRILKGTENEVEPRKRGILRRKKKNHPHKH